ncbi:MAG: glycosyltransferase, partial [Thaumarchaeota archaeon]|nr:glycosyltransferase [Nitrososphaerota archaeon]
EKTILHFGAIDPVLLGFGVAGLAYAVLRKNAFVLVWSIPFVIFLSLIGYTQYFHWLLVVPAFCIAASILIADIGKYLKQEKFQHISPIIIMVIITSFGLTSTVTLLGLDVTSNQFEAAAFAAQFASEHHTTILAGPHYSWIFRDVFEMKNIYPDYTTVLFRPLPHDFVLMSDPHYHMDFSRGEKLEQVYNYTVTIQTFESIKSRYDVYQYPYSNLGYNYDAGNIEIRITENLLD